MRVRRAQRFAIACLFAGIVVLIDQVTKAAALSALSTDERVPLVGDLLGLQLAFNPGAALSLGADFTGVLTLIGVGAVVWLLIEAWRARTTGLAVAFGFILGGALGNVIDRLFSPPGFGVGHVTDFLAYGTLFIGNLADVALGIGIVLLLGITWSRRRRANLDPAPTARAGAA